MGSQACPPTSRALTTLTELRLHHVRTLVPVCWVPVCPVQMVKQYGALVLASTNPEHPQPHKPTAQQGLSDIWPTPCP